MPPHVSSLKDLSNIDNTNSLDLALLYMDIALTDQYKLSNVESFLKGYHDITYGHDDREELAARIVGLSSREDIVSFIDYVGSRIGLVNVDVFEMSVFGMCVDKLGIDVPSEIKDSIEDSIGGLSVKFADELNSELDDESIERGTCFSSFEKMSVYLSVLKKSGSDYFGDVDAVRNGAIKLIREMLSYDPPFMDVF